MKEIAININYKGVDYLSNFDDCGKKELESVEELLKQAAEGKLTYMQFKSGNKQLFFPADILKQSILSIVFND